MPMEYTEHDRDLASSIQLQLQSGRIKFQLPPKVNSDSRRGTWAEGELRGTEPFAAFSTSGPREISLAWTYVVDGGAWTGAKIAEQVRAIRGYFAQVRAVGETRNLVVKFKMWKLGGDEPISCRIVDIDVKPSDTIVGTGDDAYPLKTDIVIGLRLWTKGAAAGAEKVQNINQLNDTETPDWY